MASLQERLRAAVEKEIRAKAAACLRKCQKDTPHRTGALRGNWYGGVPQNAPTEFDPDQITDQEADLKDWKLGDDIVIKNPCPYAAFIEYGQRELKKGSGVIVERKAGPAYTLTNAVKEVFGK